MSEELYDTEIAPLLLAAAQKCEELGLSMVAVVEYLPGVRGETRVFPKDASLEMLMLSMLAKSGNNIDSFMINVSRYCLKNGINTDESMFLSRFSRDAA